MRQPAVMNDNEACAPGSPIRVAELDSMRDLMREEILAGLSQPRKTLPCKYFYDERGSQLFDEICNLPEYYLTRTESQIMRNNADAMAAAIGSRAMLVEYGSGSSLKTRILLDHLDDLVAYVPIDISRVHLMQTARALAMKYPHIPIQPVCADYTRRIRLPEVADASPSRVVAYYPGSTIGNFEPADALIFLRSIRATCGPRSGLLIGVDLKKNPATLHAAYNDAAGVTAEFNRNLLRHVNHAIGSNFQIDAFDHYAPFNPTLGRVEMHLVSKRSQTVNLGDGVSVQFANGESIHTESCHKFTLDGFRALAGQAGYRRAAVWTDAESLFSVQYLVANETCLDG